MVAPRGACMVALWGVCMVAPRGAYMGYDEIWMCMVVPGGHAWLLRGGDVHGIRRDTEILSMSGQYASYWNAFLFQN